MTAPAPRDSHVSGAAAASSGEQAPLPQRRLRRKEAARYLGDVWGIPISAKTLAKLAVTGGGPEYRKAGRTPLYEVAALDEFARRRLSPSVSSTSELHALRRS